MTEAINEVSIRVCKLKENLNFPKSMWNRPSSYGINLGGFYDNSSPIDYKAEEINLQSIKHTFGQLDVQLEFSKLL